MRSWMTRAAVPHTGVHLASSCTLDVECNDVLLAATELHFNQVDRQSAAAGFVHALLVEVPALGSSPRIFGRLRYLGRGACGRT